MEEFHLIAHRGMSASRPENTESAFLLALEQGFHNIETDCQLSADGVPVIIHGESLEKTTNGAGLVSECSAAKLQRLDAGSWFSREYAEQRIPLLSEVLELLAEAHIHLELKSAQPDLPARVAEALWAAGWASAADARAGARSASQPASIGRNIPETLGSGKTLDLAGACRKRAWQSSAFAGPGLTITSFHLDQLRRSLQLLPRVRHGWLVQELSHGVFATAAAAAAAAGTPPLQLCPRANAVTADGIAAARAAGHAVRGWGVRSLQARRPASGSPGRARVRRYHWAATRALLDYGMASTDGPQDLDRLRACGAQGCTVNWPDVARRHILGSPSAGGC